jgi:peptidyl-tRNA hydrolase
MDAADYVLQDFHESERELLELTLTRAAECFEKLLDIGLEASMNSCNPPIDE